VNGRSPAMEPRSIAGRVPLPRRGNGGCVLLVGMSRGCPSRSGCCWTELSSVAAAIPPKGPTMLLYAALVCPI
jgi:hypothetical protein